MLLLSVFIPLVVTILLNIEFLTPLPHRLDDPPTLQLRLPIKPPLVARAHQNPQKTIRRKLRYKMYRLFITTHYKKMCLAGDGPGNKCQEC